MATRTISIALEAKVQGLVSGLRTGQQAVRDFGSRTAAFARENEEHFDRVGKAGMVMGGTLLAGAAVAVKAFMEFDSAMSQVSASTHATTADLDRLREAAINAGADTSFSAKEAAQGIDELSKAGVSTSAILTGGLAGSLNLAAAGSLAVGDSAELAATALTQFKLQGKDISHVADLLAAGAGKAQGSVEDIGNALKQSGLVASQFGLSIEDTVGTLSSFASAGLIGSDAGTSLKTMLLKLAAPSKEAAGMMSDLGIAAYDTNGQFVGVTALAGQLKDKLGGLSQAQRDSTLATIFGTDAIRGANVLYEQGATGIQGMIDKVNESGYAWETARLKTDNLAGDIERLGGSFDSVLIKGGGGAAEGLRGLVQGLEDLVDSVGKIPAPMLQFGVAAAGVVGAALLVGGALLGVVPKIVTFRASMATLSAAGGMPRTATAIGKVGKAASGAVVGLLAMQAAAALFSDKHSTSMEEYGAAILKVGKAGASVQSSDLDSIFKSFDKFGGQNIVNANTMADAVGRLANQNFNDSGNKFFEGFTNFLGLPKGEIGQLEDNLKGLGEELGSLAKNGGAENAAQTFRLLTKEFEKNGQGAKEALAYMPGYKDALLGLATAAGVTVSDQELVDWAGGKIPAAMAAATTATETYISATGNAAPVSEAMSKALEDIGINADGAVVALDKYASALVRAGLSNLSVSDAARNVQAAIDGVTDSITTNGTTLDIGTAKGRANQAAFEGVASARLAEVETMAKATDAYGNHIYSQDQLHSKMSTAYGDLIAAAGQFGITGDAADTMARKALGIPKNVNIEAYLKDFASSQLDNVGAKADGLNGKKVQIGIYTTEYFDSVDRRSRASDLNGAASGTGRPGLATGGAVFGPGTGTSDDIPAMLSNGEHVLTAADVAKMGGQAAVYRFRELLEQGRLPKFATGGAVAGHLGESANARANRLYRERVAAAKKERELLLKNATYRREQRDALYLDDARGESYRTVDDSLSSAYSFSDRLRGVANSGNVTGSQRNRLLSKANSSDAALRSLYNRSEKLAKSLDTAKSKLEGLTQVREGVRSALRDEFSISDAMKNTSPFANVTLKGIRGAAGSVLSRIRGFAGKLKKLQQMGYSGAILEEIAGMGSVEGGVAADALLKGSKAEVKDLNGTYTAIDSASKAAGTYVTDAMYKGGVRAAQGVVDGLTRQEKAIEKQMLKIGLSMENSLRSAIGARPLRKAGGGRVYGPGTTTSDSIPHMLSKDEFVIQAAAARKIGYDELERMNQGQLKPAITYRPVATTAAHPGPMEMTGTLVMDSGEVLGVFKGVATQVARSEIRGADSQAQYTRAGRR